MCKKVKKKVVICLWLLIIYVYFSVSSQMNDWNRNSELVSCTLHVPRWTVYYIHPSAIRPLVWKRRPHSNRSTLITLHLPAEPHTDTSVEADKSNEWSTAEGGRQRGRERPPSAFQFLIYLQLFKLSRPHLSDPLILSLTVLLTRVSSCPHFSSSLLHARSPSSLLLTLT